MKKILTESQRILQLNSFMNESIDDAILRGQEARAKEREDKIEEDVDEGLSSTIQNIKKKLGDKKQVRSLLKTHKQGLDNTKWAQKNGYMDPSVSPNGNTYAKAVKSSELRDVRDHIHGNKPKHVKQVTGSKGAIQYPEGRDAHGKPWQK